MTDKQILPADEPAEVFRQFAWHLAGKLADQISKPASRTGASAAKPRPAKATARRA